MVPMALKTAVAAVLTLGKARKRNEDTPAAPSNVGADQPQNALGPPHSCRSSPTSGLQPPASILSLSLLPQSPGHGPFTPVIIFRPRRPFLQNPQYSSTGPALSHPPAKLFGRSLRLQSGDVLYRKGQRGKEKEI